MNRIWLQSTFSACSFSSSQEAVHKHFMSSVRPNPLQVCSDPCLPMPHIDDSVSILRWSFPCIHPCLAALLWFKTSSQWSPSCRLLKVRELYEMVSKHHTSLNQSYSRFETLLRKKKIHKNISEGRGFYLFCSILLYYQHPGTMMDTW